MNKSKFLVAAVFGAGLALGGAEAQAKPRNTVIASPTVAIPRGSTWAWVAATSSADARVANDIVQERLQRAIERALTTKGMHEAALPGAARLLVAYHVRVADRVEPRVTPTHGAACGPRGCVQGWAGASVDLDRYTEGLLVIDLVDAQTGRLAWRSTSESRISPKDISQEKIDKIVARMMKSLPS